MLLRIFQLIWVALQMDSNRIEWRNRWDQAAINQSINWRHWQIKWAHYRTKYQWMIENKVYFMDIKLYLDENFCQLIREYWAELNRKKIEIKREKKLILTLPCSLSKSHSRSWPYGVMLQLNVSWRFVPDATKATSVRPSVRQAFWKRIWRSSCGRSRKPVYRI